MDTIKMAAETSNPLISISELPPMSEVRLPPMSEVRLPPTGLVNPFVVPGPEITAFTIPPVSETLSQHSTLTSSDIGELEANMTTGLVQPVERPGGLILSVPDVVLSRASELTNTPCATHTATSIDAIGYPAEAPTLTTFATSSHYIVEKPGPVFLSAPPAVLSRISKTKTARGEPTLFTVTAYPPILIGGPYNSSDNEPAPQTQGVDAAKVGWIIAIIVACFMTGFGIWLILRNFSARKRRRAASVRRSQGTEMLRAGAR